MRRRFSVVLFFSFFILSFLSSPTNAGLIYSTYLGGSDDDVGRSIAVDASGSAYITGYTGSSDFPTTAGAFDITFNGYTNSTSDVFVSKLNPSGTGLVYSTYLGGNGEDYGYGIAVDVSGNTYITGITNSNNFPTTSSAWDTSYNGSYDAFVSKLNSSGSALIYSTFLGGTSVDGAMAMAIDSIGNVYIMGFTESSNFPVTPSVFDTNYNGGLDTFVTKLNTTGSALLYSTYLGGSDIDQGRDIAVDNTGNSYIIGWTTSSTNFPTTVGAFDRTFNDNGSNPYDSGDYFVSKLNSNGSVLVYSTYLGGSNSEGMDVAGSGIAVDAEGNAYITGHTLSSNFPTTPGAFDTSHNSGGDVFITKINPSGSALVYSTYLGGGDGDYGSDIVLDSSGNAYITGKTSSSNFPTTPGAFDTSDNGYEDVFITKLNASGTVLLYSTYLGGGGKDWGYGITIDGSGNAYITGWTHSTDFPETPGAFDTTLNIHSNDTDRWGSPYSDIFVAKLSLVALISPYLNSYGAFTVSKDTTHWLFEKYGDGISAGTLSWISVYQCLAIIQTPGQKGKITQVFSVPSTGWYTAIARVYTDISNVSKQQKVYLYLQELDSSNAIVAAGNQVVQSGSGGLGGVWKQMQVSFYAQRTVLGVQVVGINPTNSNVTGRLYLDDIWVYAGGPTGTNPVNLVNPSFESGTTGWNIEVYADGTGPGIWSEWSGFLIGSQAGGEKGKASQLYSAPTSNTLSSIWVYSASTSMNQTQKIYLYVYSYDNAYSKIIESGNAILQPGKWTSGLWRQLQFGYTPFSQYNVVQLVGINPTGNPYQAIYFDNVEVKQ